MQISFEPLRPKTDDGDYFKKMVALEKTNEALKERLLTVDDEVELSATDTLPTDEGGGGDQGGTTRGEDSVTSALKELERWVPTEALGIYIAIFALLDPETDGPRAVVFAIGAVLTLFLTWYQVRKEREVNPQSRTTGTVVWRAVIYLVAFTVYVSALPDNVFTRFDWFSLTIGGIAAIIAVVVIPRIADVVDVPAPGEPA